MVCVYVSGWPCGSLNFHFVSKVDGDVAYSSSTPMAPLIHASGPAGVACSRIMMRSTTCGCCWGGGAVGPEAVVVALVSAALVSDSLGSLLRSTRSSHVGVACGAGLTVPQL